MAKGRPGSDSSFECVSCGAITPKWSGRCPTCDEWNTLVEAVVARPPAQGGGHAGPVPITDIGIDDHLVWPTGLAEFDRVVGGGLVDGSVTLLGGEPGVGKSTLVLQLAACVAASGQRVLYVTGEESAQQVALRGERIGIDVPSLLVAADNDVERVAALVARTHPTLVVVDSVQSMHDPDLGSPTGSVAQVRNSAHMLGQAAKRGSVAVVLVGQVVKDGSLAGPRVVEHSVDTVLRFEGDRHHTLRLLRATKHRFGSTDELGVLQMGRRGLDGVADASGLFLTDRCPGVSGSAVAATLEGQRALLVEVQALVGPRVTAMAQRSTKGLDARRLGQLLAVLDRRAGRRSSDVDVHASVAGGARVVEPGVDLALAAAIVSSMFDRPLPEGLVAWGEIGLGGEVRQVVHGERRLAEAARLGFETALVPASMVGADSPLRLIPVGSLPEALYQIGLGQADPLVGGR